MGDALLPDQLFSCRSFLAAAILCKFEATVGEPVVHHEFQDHAWASWAVPAGFAAGWSEAVVPEFEISWSCKWLKILNKHGDGSWYLREMDVQFTIIYQLLWCSPGYQELWHLRSGHCRSKAWHWHKLTTRSLVSDIRYSNPQIDRNVLPGCYRWCFHHYIYYFQVSHFSFFEQSFCCSRY